MTTHTQRRIVAARCPLRPGEPCTLCHPDARSGPQDCPTVALVMDDEQMREEFAKYRSTHSQTSARP